MQFQENLKEQLLNSVGEFTWDFGCQFFVETQLGNYVWSDPDYNGDNTLKRFNGNYPQWCKQRGIPYGRDKGRHVVKNYCSDNVIIVGKI
jgi:hypothetical protein